MTVMLHHCGWTMPHAPHVFDVVHPSNPYMVTKISCKGTPVPPMYPPVSDDEVREAFKR